MKRGREKLLAALLGSLLVLSLFEVALRVTGDLYWRPSGRPGHDAEELLQSTLAECPACTRILCVGDSHTYGVGASSGMDYPAQLERRLNLDRQKTYQVVNGGLGGSNSSMVLAQLPQQLEVTKPALVVAMAGNSNGANAYGYLSYSRKSSWGAILDELLNQVRIVRFARNIATDLRRKRGTDAAAFIWTMGGGTSLGMHIRWKQAHAPEADSAFPEHFMEGAKLLDQRHPQQAIPHFQACLAAAPGNSSCFWGLGRAHQDLHDGQTAAMWFTRGIKADPTDPSLYFGVGETRLDANNLSADTEQWFRRGIEADPDFAPNYMGVAAVRGFRDWNEAIAWNMACLERDPEFDRCYTVLVQTYQRQGRTAELIELLEPLAERSELAASYLELNLAESFEAELDAWMADDLRQLVALSRKNDAQVLLQEYPMPCRANGVLRQLAEELGVPLAANEDAFRALTKGRFQGGQRYFARDGHLNDLGYEDMARRLA